MSALRGLAYFGCLALAGCASSNPHQLKWRGESLLSKAGPPLGEQFTGVTTGLTQFRALATPAVLVRVDSLSLPGFDRLGFTFSGKTVPAYQLLYKKEGAPQGILFEMRFGARVASANGKARIPKSQQQRSLNYPAVKSVSQERTGEEYVIWTALLAKESEYRVSEQTNPPRIVVDFKH